MDKFNFQYNQTEDAAKSEYGFFYLFKSGHARFILIGRFIFKSSLA